MKRMKQIELSDSDTRYLYEGESNYHFFCIDYGTSLPREMVVRWLIFNEVSGKRFLVYTPTNDIGEKYLREYFGDYREKRFIRIANEQIRRSINNIIQQMNTEQIV